MFLNTYVIKIAHTRDRKSYQGYKFNCPRQGQSHVETSDEARYNKYHRHNSSTQSTESDMWLLSVTLSNLQGHSSDCSFMYRLHISNQWISFLVAPRIALRRHC